MNGSHDGHAFDSLPQGTVSRQPNIPEVVRQEAAAVWIAAARHILVGRRYLEPRLALAPGPHVRVRHIGRRTQLRVTA
jgi:hypothetical protein